MKGAVNLEGLFFTWETEKKRKKENTHPFAFSIQPHTNSFSKFPLVGSWLRQQQAAFGSPESQVDLPSSVSFPWALVVCHLVSTCSHTHTHTHTDAGSWWRKQVRESCTCCPVNKIPQSDAETSSFTQQSFPQVWEHECFTKHVDCDTTELISWFRRRSAWQKA